MSISAITYANRLMIEDNNGSAHPSIMQYKSGDTNYMSFPGDRKILSTPIGIEVRSDLLTLKNGLRIQLIIEHKVQQVETQRYKHYYHYEIHGYIGSSEVQGDNSGLPVSAESPGEYVPYNTFPLMDTVYVWYGGTHYNVNGGPNVPGDPVSLVCPYCEIWYKFNETGYEDLLGDLDYWGGLQGHWNNLSSVPSLLSDTGYNNFIAKMGRTGSGENPYSAGEPEPEPEGPDPSTPGGGDTPTGGPGEAVDFPDLPTTNVIQSGLVTLYNPSNQELRSLAQVLWGNDFEQTIKKILNDPFDGIIGLALLPFSPTTAGTENCQIGNFNTKVPMHIISNQWVTLDCGSLNITESWMNALDYSPNTIIEVYIPFVGFRQIKTEDVMRYPLSLKYNVDLLSGAAIAMLKCNNKVLYTYPCKLTYDVPLTGSNRAALYTGMINIAMSAIRGAAMGGALGAAGGAATSAIQTATSKQSDVDRSGAVTSNTGDLGEFTPYIVIHRPVQSMPKNFKQIKGYQSNITAVLGDCTGYTEVDYIHLDGISGATDTELAEIEQLLKNGVII